MSDSDFSGSDLVLGSVHGMRTFNVHHQALLFSPVFSDQPFSTGWNTASCTRGENHVGERVASLDCTCGFYAYFDDGDFEYASTCSIDTVVEAKGTITMGSRGFRAEQMRVVGLIDPRDDFLSMSPWSRFITRLYQFNVPAVALWMSMMFILALLYPTSSPWWLDLGRSALFAILIGPVSAMSAALMIGIAFPTRNSVAYSKYTYWKSSNRIDELRRIHGDLVWFESMAEARRTVEASNHRDHQGAS